MTTESYIRLRFPRGSHDDILQALLHDFCPLGFLDEDDTWEAYFDADRWDEGVAMQFAEVMEGRNIVTTYDIERFEKRNWNKEWEDSITPVRVSERLIITPSWHVIKSQGDEIVLVIDPKMSFGTGFHPTTRLMLRLLQGAVTPGDRVLDVGTGTGVLAIAAIKLGAAFAEGIDTDEWSMENALENCVRNGISDRVSIHRGSLEAVHGPYEVILSNITRNDNIAMLPGMSDMLLPGGRIILSGFLTADRQDMLQALSMPGIDMTHELHEHEWHALCGVKKKT
jgi:ribosomal protein L11 methyltransferase